MRRIMSRSKRLTALLLALLLFGTCTLTGCQPTAQVEPTATPQATTALTPEPIAEASAFSAGTFTAVAAGRNGPLVVQVTTSETEILDVQVTEHSETSWMGDPAIERIPQEIQQFQTLNVDTVSGATITSYAILNAAASALEEAGADVEALRNAPKPVVEKGEDAQEQVDLLICGGGGAGLSAAITAGEQGKNVLVVEKLAVLGGSTGHSSGALLHITEEDDELAYFSADHFYQYVLDMSAGGNPICQELARKVIDNTQNTVDWLKGLGYQLNYEITGSRPDYPQIFRLSNPSEKGFVRPSGMGIIKALKGRIDALDGVEIMMETKAESLLTDASGAVTGAVCTRADGSTLTVTAENVILATGGWDQSKEMADRFAPYVNGAMKDTGPGSTGDGIVMAEAVGATLHPIEFGTGGGMYQSAASPAMYVSIDENGNRFVNEDEYYSFVFRTMFQSGSTRFFRVFDSAAVGEDAARLDKAVEEGKAWKADTIEELAQLIGVDQGNFLRTVERYNSMIGQVDEDFGRAAERMVGLMEAPFYATAQTPQITTSAGPVKINDQAQVVRADGSAIPNLYAVGDLVSLNFSGGSVLYSGSMLQWALNTGRIAAETIVGLK